MFQSWGLGVDGLEEACEAVGVRRLNIIIGA